MVIKVGPRAYIPSVYMDTGGDSMPQSMGPVGGMAGLPPIPDAGVNPLAHYGQTNIPTPQPTIPSSFPMLTVPDQGPVQFSQPQA